MNDDQITALAREYAEEVYKNDESNPEVPVCLTRELKQQTAEYAEEIFRWLCRRYCLVEKSKVEEEYHEATMDCGNIDPCSDLWEVRHAERCLIESLFPEIGKEVEG